MAKLRAAYDAVVAAAVVVAFTAMLGAALAGTLSRYLTFLPVIAWGEEVTRFAGIWSSFLVSGLAIRHGSHLGVDLATARLPAAVRRWVYLFCCLLMLAFCGLLLVYGLRLAARNVEQISPALEWSMGVVYLCIPIGAALMIVEIVGLLIDWSRGLPPPKPPLEETVE
jgi:TRAP-type C4-dicarboxylate transport system permease small subunit